MEVRYEPKLVMLREAAMLLRMFCNKDTVQESDNERARMARLNARQREVLQGLQAIVDNMERELDLTPDERALLQADYEQNNEKIACECSALFPFMQAYSLDIDTVVETVEHASEAQLRTCFLYDALDPGNEHSGKEAHFPPEISMEAFLRIVAENTLWTSENRCHILSVFADYHQSFAKALPVVRRMLAILEGHLPAVQPYLNHWESQMRLVAQQGEESQLMQHLLECVPLIYKCDYPFEFRPVLAYYSGLHISVHSMRSQAQQELFPTSRPGLICPGVAFFDISEIIFDHQGIDEGETLAALKLLSDKSKYDILKNLKQAPCYGAQLAQKLGLSPATISHHMNTLLSQELVRFDVQENRVYYHLDTRRMREMMDRLRHIFLDE